MVLLAQNGDAEAAAAAAGFLALGLGILLIFLLVILAIAIVISWLIYSVQVQVPPEHRKIAPGLIWLLIIPFFNVIWNFFVFLQVPDSLKSYFDAQGRTDVGDCGRTLGLWSAVLLAVGFLGGFIPLVGCFASFVWLAGLVLLILFLVKILGLKGQIAMAPGTGSAPAAPPPAVPPPAG